MFSPFEYKIMHHALLEERIQEAQACHASQRRMLEQFSQAMNWVGNRLIVWSQQLQPQQPSLHLHIRHVL